MVNLKNFQVSDEIFWGYKITLDIDFFNNEKDLIKIVKEDMKLFFKKFNLIMLSEKLDYIEFHIPNLNNIKQSNNQIIYICSHKHCNCCNCIN